MSGRSARSSGLPVSSDLSASRSLPSWETPASSSARSAAANSLPGGGIGLTLFGSLGAWASAIPVTNDNVSASSFMGRILFPCLLRIELRQIGPGKFRPALFQLIDCRLAGVHVQRVTKSQWLSDLDDSFGCLR